MPWEDLESEIAEEFALHAGRDSHADAYEQWRDWRHEKQRQHRVHGLDLSDGVCYATAEKRLRLGWPLLRAVTRPPQKQERRIGRDTGLTRLAVENGLNPSTAYCRVIRYGWTFEEAVSKPARQRLLRYAPDGRLWSSIAAQHHVDRKLFCTRLKRGWSVERAALTPPAGPPGPRKCK